MRPTDSRAKKLNAIVDAALLEKSLLALGVKLEPAANPPAEPSEISRSGAEHDHLLTLAVLN